MKNIKIDCHSVKLLCEWIVEFDNEQFEQWVDDCFNDGEGSFNDAVIKGHPYFIALELLYKTDNKHYLIPDKLLNKIKTKVINKYGQ